MHAKTDQTRRGWAAVMTAESLCVPRRAAEISEQLVDGGALLFDTRTDRTLMLNETALAAWHACDGKRTLADLIEHLTRTYAVPEGLAADHLEELVPLFAEAGLLETGPDPQ